ADEPCLERIGHHGLLDLRQRFEQVTDLAPIPAGLDDRLARPLEGRQILSKGRSRALIDAGASELAAPLILCGAHTVALANVDAHGVHAFFSFSFRFPRL